MDIEYTFKVAGIVAGGMTTVVFPAIWAAFCWYYKTKLERLDHLEEKCKTLKEKTHIQTDQLNEASKKIDKERQRGDDLEQQLETQTTGRVDDEAAYDGYRAKWKRTHEGLLSEIDALKKELKVKSESHIHLQLIQERLGTISSLDGKLWNRSLPAKVPSFISRQHRRTKIISVLNLKGGVGKTTITANLGAVLSESENVLMIDLDFQRSLSRLLLSTLERTSRHFQKHCLQHLLWGQDHSANRLLEKLGSPIHDERKCWLLPNSDNVREPSETNDPDAEDDSLEETEIRLMFNWIFDRDPKDIRFLLREALHAPQIDEQFSYVLLDCPPRLTTACINALAASDYVLVPVTLDGMSTNSVHYLLKNLNHLKKVLPELEVLGIVANKVSLSGGALIRRHADAWDALKHQCDRLKPSVHLFDATIKEEAAIGIFATECIEEEKRTLFETKQYEKTRDAFEALALEIQEVIASRQPKVAAAENNPTEHSAVASR